MSQERSAEFLRGAVQSAREADAPWLEAKYHALLAEAEAREAQQPSAAEVIAAAERALAPICKNADEAERLLNEGWVEKHQCIANKLQFGDVIMAKDALAAIAKWKEANRAE